MLLQVRKVNSGGPTNWLWINLVFGIYGALWLISGN
ncbi:hypothetical protein HDF10_000482 [Edaphobacter lichenicola]|uniref:Uncharacterized protein n=1 Tax=Tunturiibacter lichenicola TaxID=2051959 RepID=A0A7W8J4P3_9BACT|nr:hypothetical protein [Edaphobacter lichenicola]